MKDSIKKTLIAFFLLLAFFALFEGCSGMRGKTFRIGMDESFLNENFGAKNAYVVGYVEELLMEISKKEGMNFAIIDANWDSIYHDLETGKYDAIVSSLSPHNFNEAKYDFSKSFLHLGPVLVVPKKSKGTSLKKLDGKLIGLVSGYNTGINVVQRYPHDLIQMYPTMPELFDALAKDEIDALVVDRTDAVSYINEVYYDNMKMVDESLTEDGLRILTKDGSHKRFLMTFDRAIHSMRKKSSLTKLMSKWHLTIRR